MSPAGNSSSQVAVAEPPKGRECFATTQWGMVVTAAGDSPESGAALEQLCRCYWYPLYAFVRRFGYGPHDAQDLTQAFFAELFRKNYFRAADRERGRFRSFLLTALRHFLAHQWERARAAKRGAGLLPICWDEYTEAELQYQQDQRSASSAERLYDRSWALRVFEQSLARLRQEFTDDAKLTQFELLKNYLTQEPGLGAYAAAGATLGMSPNAVAVMVYRLRQRYAGLVRECVAETVAQPGQVQEELSYLISLICD